MGRKTLGEVYGAPLYGIKTGLNKAFVIGRAIRDRLVAQDPRSAELLKPFLRGENVKRWRVESEDLWLINTPRGKIDIEQYPAVKSWLLPFKPELEKRATKQEWWELQQAQLVFQPAMEHPKIVYPEFSQGPKFSFDRENYFVSNKCFFFNAPIHLLAILNHRVAWFWLFGEASPLRGGQWRLELREQYVERLPIPDSSDAALEVLAQICTQAAHERYEIQAAVRHRVLDLAPPELKKLTGKLENFHELDFAGFREQVKKAFHADIPVKERRDWEIYIAESGAEVRWLTNEIEAAEQEIDAIVYKLFDLTPEEIALLEASLAGQY